MVEKVIVLGGGSAGFLAALALKKVPGVRVIVIRSKEIGIIGVGEGSTLPLTQFLHGFLGLGDKAFLEIARPTWKLLAPNSIFQSSSQAPAPAVGS